MDTPIKDSGKREDFLTGAVRDTEEGKPRYDLISIPALTRLAHHLRKGAEKYSARNWEKGMDYSRLYSSALRHLMQWASGDRDEDHLAAVLFNVMALAHFDELGHSDLDDMPCYKALHKAECCDRCGKQLIGKPSGCDCQIF